MTKLFYYLAKKYMSVSSKIKNKKPYYLYLYSEILYKLIMILQKDIRNFRLKKLNSDSVRTYYNIYGREETLKHFKLSEKALEELLFK